MTDQPEPAPVAAPPAEPPPASPQRPPWLPFAIGAAVVVAIAVGALLLSNLQHSRVDEDAYTVQEFTPATELITASEGVIGHEAPDSESPAAVMFGAGVSLAVTGRVSRGIGNDWYAVTWNERTVFVRTQDAVAGSGAPPAPVVREEEPEEEVEEEERPTRPLPQLPPIEEDIARAPAPGGTLEISQVNWIREPSARDFARYFPDAALERGQSGRVVLDCAIGGNGRLNCSIAQESPSGLGFGRAALSISRQVRVASTLPDGSPAAGRHLRLPLNFRAG